MREVSGSGTALRSTRLVHQHLLTVRGAGGGDLIGISSENWREAIQWNYVIAL